MRLLRIAGLSGLLLFLCITSSPVVHAQVSQSAVESPERAASDPWVVVVFSSVNRERAEAAAQRFRKQLPDERVEILMLGRSQHVPYRVAVGSYASLETAKAARKQMRGLPGDAWYWEVPSHAVAINQPLAPMAREYTSPLSGPGPLPFVLNTTRTQPFVGEPWVRAEDDSLAWSVQAAGQQTGGRAAKQIEAVPLDTRIQIDGRLSETAWQVPGVTDFRQRSPKNGAPPSEETEVWVAFDDDALYVAARCYDREPARVSSVVQRRDSEVEGDWFSVSFDTYRDYRTGFFFLVTPGGTIQDGTIYDEVRLDKSWDGVWERATALDSLGWSVEMRIPFAQLRFDPQQIWGINVARGIHRTNEDIDLLAPRGRKVSFFADLVGLQHARTPMQLEITPYVVAQAETYEANHQDPFLPGREFGSRFGGDVTLRINPSLAIDGAINPDFGQVEVDPAVINLTAQETFFEEKRPFFLEDARLFDFGSSQEMRFFHSRRIGQAPVGTPVHPGYSDIPDETRILGAAKLAGKLGDAWSVGWMNVVTARTFAQVDSAGVRFEDEVAPLSYYDVVRVRRERNAGKQAIGFFGSGVWRDLEQPHLQPILNNRAVVGGVDGWTFFGKRDWWMLEGWASMSHVGGDSLQVMRLQEAYQRYYQRPDAAHLNLDEGATALNGGAGEVRLSKRGGNLQMRSGLKMITPGFELNDLGYLLHADKISGDLTVLYGQWQPKGVINRGYVGVTVARTYDFGWTRLGDSYTVFTRAQFANFWDANLSTTYAPEGLDVRGTRGGPSMAAPEGWTGSASLSTSNSKPLIITLSGSGNRDTGGSWSYGLSSDFSWRPAPQLSLSVTPWWSSSVWEAGFLRKRTDPLAVDTYSLRNIFATLAQDYFSTDFRLQWSFTPKLSLQAFFQLYRAEIRYDRFKELAEPGTFAFDVYGEGESTISERDEYGGYTIDPDGPGEARSFIIYDPNFDFASLRGTSVLRWEYRKGSTLFLAWTHDRFIYEDFWQAPEGGLLAASPFNKFVFKLTFWLNP